MKQLVKWILLCVVGVILFFVGISEMNATEVTCGSQVMKPGDSCTTTRKGRSTTRSYTEQRDSDRAAGTAMTFIGPALLLLGGFLIFREKKKIDKARAAMATAGGGQPWYGQPQTGPDGQVVVPNSQPGYPQPGQPPTGPQGFPQQGYPQPGQPQPGYPQTGPQGFPQQPGYPQPVPQGYPQQPHPGAPQGYPQPVPGQYPQPGQQPPPPYQS